MVVGLLWVFAVLAECLGGRGWVVRTPLRKHYKIHTTLFAHCNSPHFRVARFGSEVQPLEDAPLVLSRRVAGHRRRVLM